LIIPGRGGSKSRHGMSGYNVLLPHNSADKPAVEELAHRLVKKGIQPWLDTWNLIPGKPWQEAIEVAPDQSSRG
jgi:hypothetical protein